MVYVLARRCANGSAPTIAAVLHLHGSRSSPSSPLGFGGAGFGASVIVFPIIALQGRQIAFERPCCHSRTSRRELSGEVRNCHLKPSNRSSDSLNDLLNSSSESIASSSDFIEHSALLKASRVVEPLSEGSDASSFSTSSSSRPRRLPNRLQSPLLALEVVAHLIAELNFLADFAVQAVELGHFFRDSAVDFRSLRPLFIDLGSHGTQFDIALNPKLLETVQLALGSYRPVLRLVPRTLKGLYLGLECRVVPTCTLYASRLL